MLMHSMEGGGKYSMAMKQSLFAKRISLSLLAFLFIALCVAPTEASAAPVTSITATYHWLNDTSTYFALAPRVPDQLTPQGHRLTLVTPLHTQAIPVDQDTFTHTFSLQNLPLVDANNNPIDYTVVQIRDPQLAGNLDNFIGPPGYLRVITKDGQGQVTITNTFQDTLPPLKNGDRSTPCQIDWYNQIAMDRTLWGTADYDYNRIRCPVCSPGAARNGEYSQAPASW